MRIRTQRNLINSLAAGLVLLGLIVVGSSVASPPQPPDLSPVRTSDLAVDEDQFTPRVADMSSLLNKKLQGPLEIPKQQSVAAKAPKPKQNWPKVSLENIFAGEASKLAVFSNDRQTYSCAPGDRFLNVLVKSIDIDRVELVFAGETRTYRTGDDADAKRSGQ